MTEETFGQALERLMLRARVWDTTLARRMGVSRSEVFRWRTGRAVPSSRNVSRLASGLHWPSGGVLRPLTSDEQDLLLVLAGHTDSALQAMVDLRNRVELPDRCVVHAYQYAPHNFPSQWSRRANEIEQEVQGAMHSMLHGTPTFLRPESVTRIYHRWYDAEVVEQYVVELEQRLLRWKRRIAEYEVRHIYSKPLLAEYLRNRRWQGVQLSTEQVREQVAMLLDLLDGFYPNFSIGLDEDMLPFDATVVGHEVVLLTLRQANMVNAAGWTIFGMEMTGLSVVKTFSQAFDRTWGKRSVVKDPAAVRAWFDGQL